MISASVPPSQWFLLRTSKRKKKHNSSDSPASAYSRHTCASLSSKNYIPLQKRKSSQNLYKQFLEAVDALILFLIIIIFLQKYFPALQVYIFIQI